MKRFAFALVLLAATALNAQSTVVPATIPPPIVPLVMHYQYWPEQFVQWVGDELPYSMIELDADDSGSKPVYDVVLTDRSTYKRSHYSNTPAVVAAGKAQDGESWLANDISFIRPEAATTGAIFTLQLTLHDGKPLEWRFIQGSDVMQQGGGLSPLPAAPVPVLAYREEAAVAGEGTMLQVGNISSAAMPWTEISHPPYFVAWHGAYSLGATTLILSPGEEKWTITAAPSSLAKGATWKLLSTTGQEQTIRTEKVEGSHATLKIESGPSSIQHALEATWDGNAWHFEQIHFTPPAGEKHSLTIQFAPALSVGNSNVDILVGKTRIVTASVTTDATNQATLNFKSPDWIKSKSLTESVAATSTEVTLKAATH